MASTEFFSSTNLVSRFLVLVALLVLFLMLTDLLEGVGHQVLRYVTGLGLGMLGCLVSTQILIVFVVLIMLILQIVFLMFLMFSLVLVLFGEELFEVGILLGENHVGLG